MICPYCKISIDEDSFFCDQCGKEILVCPKCHNPGKGKMCTSDGTSLVSMKDNVSATSGAEETSTQVSVPVSLVSNKDELHLINRNLGFDLKIVKDSLIGRDTGDFVDVFGKYSQISGQHLQINFDSERGWIVVDLGSTNGTKYNNNPLKPMQPQVLTDKSYLCIANIECYVQILTKKKSDKTGTVRL